MPEKCIDDPRDCPLFRQVEALERANEQHGNTHREMFDRLRALETSDAVQNAHYKAIDAKLDELTLMVRELSGKAGKRWDGLVDKVIWAVAAAVIAFLLAKIGL